MVRRTEMIVVMLVVALGAAPPALASAKSKKAETGEQVLEIELPENLGPAPSGVAGTYAYDEENVLLNLRPIAAPVFKGEKMVQNMYFRVSLVVRDAEVAEIINERRPRLHDLILGVLSRGSYARTDAPRRIDVGRLRDDLERAITPVFGIENVIDVLLTETLPGRR